MENQEEPIKIPTYTVNRSELVQITEQIVNGKKVITREPLQAYQTIQRATDQGKA